MKTPRSPWPLEFTKTGKIPWRCPGCEASVLQLDAASLRTGETSASVEAGSADAWEPEWTDGRFTCLLRCPNCKAGVAVAGTYRVQDDRYVHELYGESGDYESYFRPRYFSDPPSLVPLPETVPDELRAELTAAFRLFWIDEEACGNRIRRGVEELLSEQGVRKTTTVSKGARKGERVRLSLHDRIVRFQATQEEIGNALMAVKWIGNAGSHPGKLDIDALRDGFELMAYALDELYVRQRSRMARIARDVNRRRGPRSSRHGAS